MQPTVVAGENEDCAISQPERIDLFYEPPDSLVECFDHRGVSGIESFRVLLNRFWCRGEWNVRAVVRHKAEERSVAIVFDEFFGRCGDCEFSFTSYISRWRI